MNRFFRFLALLLVGFFGLSALMACIAMLSWISRNIDGRHMSSNIPAAVSVEPARDPPKTSEFPRLALLSAVVAGVCLNGMLAQHIWRLRASYSPRSEESDACLGGIIIGLVAAMAGGVIYPHVPFLGIVMGGTGALLVIGSIGICLIAWASALQR